MSRVASILMLVQFGLGSSAVYAAEGKWECTSGALKREISITFEDSAKKAPCHVMYKKDSRSEEAATALWTAANDSSFCEQKAKGFVEKLGGLGWTCQ